MPLHLDEPMSYGYDSYNGDETEEIPDVTCTAETIKAILCRLGKDKWRSRSMWIPKSVVHRDSEVCKTETSGTLVVARWFAEKEELG